MKPSQLFFFLFFLLICFSCKNRKEQVEENWDVTYIDIDSCVVMKSPAELRFLKLETTRDCLISYIKKIDFDDNKIFIRDSNEKIFVFDDHGKFLNVVGRIGQGPDEQFSIIDFYLDKEKKKIGLIDVLKSTVFIYSYTGDLLEKKQVIRGIFKDFSHSYLVDEHTLLLIKDNFIDSKYNFNLVSGKNYDRVDRFVPYLFIGQKWSQSRGYKTVSQPGNQTLISALMSDTIYRYDPGAKSIVPDMVFRGKCRPMTQKDVEGKYLEIAMDALQTAKEKKLSYGITSFEATKKHITFAVQDYNSLGRVIWNRETKKGFVTPSIEDYMHPNVLSHNFLGHIVSSTDDTFVCFVQADDFISSDWIGKIESAKKVIDDTLEDDNPILVFYHFVE